MVKNQIYLYQESCKLRKVLSEDERLNSNGGRGYIASGVFSCDFEVVFPKNYFNRQLDSCEQSELIKLTRGKFVPFK